MPKLRCIVPRAFVLLALCGMVPAAWAQANGNIRNGQNLQPTEGEVRSRERAAGETPPLAEQRRETGTVDSLYQTLMRKERADGMVTGSPDPNAPMDAASPRVAPR